jgi:DNA modification methylase
MLSLLQGDCLEEMRELPDNSVDAVVTDPPYGLSFMGKKWDYDVPDVEIWEECLRVLKPGGYLLAFAGTRTQHRMAVRIEDAGFEIRDMIAWVYGSGFPKSLNIGKAVDKLHGNEREETHTETKADSTYHTQNVGSSIVNTSTYSVTKCTSEWQGRFPANLIHDGSDEVVELFPNTKSQGPWSKIKTTGFGEFGNGKSEYMGVGEKDKLGGSASRFFYCAKASKSERNKGCEGLEEKQNLQGLDNRGRTLEREDGSKTLVDRFSKTPAKNNHPTVKPLKLMEYLVKLVSREGAVVLDPFMGSGTTGIACRKLNRKFIGIEMEEDYIKIAKARINSELQKTL